MSLETLSLSLNPLSQASLFVLFFLILAELLILKKQKKGARFSLSAIFGILAVYLLITAGIRFWLSQKYFSTAQKSAKANLGEEAVRQLTKAVRFNPLNDTYRLSLAQASLSLANQEAQKENADQKEVERLVQQAIEEGKKATLLNPNKTENWLGLGNIYRFLGNVSGASDWALKCYQKASVLEPDNAQIHELIAAIYYSQGKIAETKAELETALSLTGKNSSDFQRIRTELQKLE